MWPDRAKGLLSKLIFASTEGDCVNYPSNILSHSSDWHTYKICLSSQFNFRICWNSRQTWCLTHEFTSLWLHMHLSSLLRRPTMSNSAWLRSPMRALNQQTRWWSVILVMASTWHAVCCIEVMLYPKMSMLPSLPSRLRGLFSLWTGAQLDLRLISFYFSEQLKNIFILPHRRDWIFLWVRGGSSIRPKNLKKCTKLYWKVIVPLWRDPFGVQPSAPAPPFLPLSDL